MTKWRGVNLGGWLVLERWITPGVFAATDAGDEYSLCRQLGDKASDRLKDHRDSFITEQDIGWLAAQGVNALRLPVGYWIFGDEPPYLGNLGYVDRLFVWATKYKLAVILDLHGVPGSQNGEHHSGRAGKIGWGDEASISRTLDVLGRLAERYAGQPALAGIELLNEPSWRLGRRRLTGFYEQAYRRIRDHCGPEIAVIFSDAFRPRRWNTTLTGPSYENVMMDVHFYQLFQKRDRWRPGKYQLRKAAKRQKLLEQLQRHHPVIIGEWSLALQSKAGGIQAQYAEAQLKAMADAAGWFFWTYRTENADDWNFRVAVERGWLKIAT